MRRNLLCLAIVLLAGLAGAADQRWAMRDRVFCSADWGMAFRYPYDYQIPDQYQAALRGGGAAAGGAVRIPVGENLTPQQIRKMLQEQLATARTSWNVRGFCFVKDSLSSDLGDLTGKPLTEVASLLIADACQLKLPFEEADYYEAGSAKRPHADPAWAPAGLAAVRVTSAAKYCGWLIETPDRYLAVLCTGAASDAGNALVLDSFEVLAEYKREGRVTWRHAQTLQGQVMGGDGQPVKARSWRGKADSVAWTDGWDVETAHYHLQSHSSPQKALYFAGLLEALYEMFIAVYQPDTVPPYKMEIKVFATQRDFMAASGANGVPVGPTVGGFFMPGQLVIFAYEDSESVGGKDFSVEHVLAHECSHQFLHTTCNGSRHVPTWVNEGMAVYFENAQYQRGKFTWKAPEERLGYLKQQYAAFQRPLSGLDFYIRHYGHIPGDRYAEVYAMLHLFVFRAPGGKERFKEYWHALKKGEDGTEAFERIFLDDMVKAKGSLGAALQYFDNALVEYVTKTKGPYQQ